NPAQDARSVATLSHFVEGAGEPGGGESDGRRLPGCRAGAADGNRLARPDRLHHLRADTVAGGRPEINPPLRIPPRNIELQIETLSVHTCRHWPVSPKGVRFNDIDEDAAARAGARGAKVHAWVHEYAIVWKGCGVCPDTTGVAK